MKREIKWWGIGIWLLVLFAWTAGGIFFTNLLDRETDQDSLFNPVQ